MLSEPGVIQWLDAVRISTKEKTVAGRADTGTELIATVKQSTDPYIRSKLL